MAEPAKEPAKESVKEPIKEPEKGGTVEATRTRSRESKASIGTGSSLDPKKGEFGYPSGHLGHLTGNQAAALADFRQLLKEKNLIKDGENGEPDSHDDVQLLRFLRARRFVPKDALQQFKDTEEWRAKNEIDNLYQNIDVNQFHETWKLYPQWTGRRDKRGLPLYVFEVAPLNAKRMAEYAKHTEKTTILHSKLDHSGKGKGAIPPRLYRLFALYENLMNFMMPLCTALRDRPIPHTPISQANNIVDISKVGIKQFWNLRGHMQDASVLATAHYPETLDRIFIVGAPTFFPTVWEWIKRWFDPITVSKIFILSEANAYKVLSEFIDPANIPKKYGGELPFEFGGGPVLDPHFMESLTWKKKEATWPRGPVRWEPAEDGTWRLIGLGSVDGKERREELATFTPDPEPGTVDDNTEAPDRAIDFATNEVVIARNSLSRPTSPTSLRSGSMFRRYSSGPPSPTILKQRSGNEGDPFAGASSADKSASQPEGEVAKQAMREEGGSIEAGLGIDPVLPLDPAKAAAKPGDIPLAATTTPLPDHTAKANGEAKEGGVATPTATVVSPSKQADVEAALADATKENVAA